MKPPADGEHKGVMDADQHRRASPRSIKASVFNIRGLNVIYGQRRLHAGPPGTGFPYLRGHFFEHFQVHVSNIIVFLRVVFCFQKVGFLF